FLVPSRAFQMCPLIQVDRIPILSSAPGPAAPAVRLRGRHRAGVSTAKPRTRAGSGFQRGVDSLNPVYILSIDTHYIMLTVRVTGPAQNGRERGCPCKSSSP